MRGRFAAALVLAAAVVAVGCGSEDFPNEPRPPAGIDLSARVSNGKVVVVPDRVGAGLATVTVSNQSDDDVQLDFVGPNRGGTEEILAGGVGSLRINLEEGDYRVEPSVPSIGEAELTVGTERPSAQNDLLLP